MPYSALQSYARRMGGGAQQNASASRAGYVAFDPTQYAQSTAGSIMNSLMEQYSKRLQGNREAANARGFIHSGMGQGAATRDLNDSLANALAGLSMQAGGMRMNQLSSLYGGDREDLRHYEGMEADLTMSEQHQRQTDRSSKRSMWGNIIGGGLVLAGGALAMFSDETLKEDIDLIPDALPKARRIRGKTWGWNEEGRRLTGRKEGERQAGVIAQEVEREFPYLVKNFGGKRVVDYGGLTGVLFGAVGELAEKVDRLSETRR
jgi:hypothetical protein